MTLSEIKTAVDAGLSVHWANVGYRVVKGKGGDYLIGWDIGGRDENYIGLTCKDGATMNGEESDFFIGA